MTSFTAFRLLETQVKLQLRMHFSIILSQLNNDNDSDLRAKGKKWDQKGRYLTNWDQASGLINNILFSITTTKNEVFVRQ